MILIQRTIIYHFVTLFVDYIMKKILVLVLFSLVFSQISLKLLGEDFDKPIYATSQNKNSDLIYVVEQSGFIWII